MRTTLSNFSLAGVLVWSAPSLLGCIIVGGDDGAATDETGDGDGDGGDGDGDGDTGDMGDGDGDTGDGDGDTGDGDGDTGDGDGDGASLPGDFPASLTKAGGCGDVYIGVTNDDATVGILFNGADIAVTAHDLGETQVRESVLPSPDVDLRAAIGTLLNEGCNDTGEGPQITHEWTAVSGTVTLTVVPTGIQEPWANPADATLELTNVTFEAQGLEPVVVDSWIVQDVYVGWLPG